MNSLRNVGQRLASSLDLDQVLDAVGENALKSVKATDVHIFPYDEESGEFSPGVGVWSDGHRGTVVPLPRSDGFTGQVARAKRQIILNDAENHPLFQSSETRAWGLRAIAGFPIIRSDRVLAVLNVAYLEPHEFTRREEEALLVLCDQAAIAIDNARLYLQVQRKIQELSALNAVSQSAAQLTDIRTMLNDAVGTILSAINADAALITTPEPQKETLELAAQRGLPASTLNELKLHPLKVGEGFAGEVVQSGKPNFVRNTSQYERVLPRRNLEPYASIYSVPLRAYDRVIGVLHLLWKELHQLSPTEVNLIGAISPQLAIAMHNSSLFFETKRRADELATLRAIGLATTSTLNLREQLRLLYENINQLLQAETFFVGLYDETRDELRIEYIVEEGWFLRPLQVPLDQAGLSGWVLRNRKPLLIGDIETAENLPLQPAHITRPARSWLGVPLLLKERVVGLLSAQSFRPNALTSEDERFLIAVAQHVALALDNARLFAESERRARELTLLNEISRAISASLDLDDIMERAAHALAEQLGYRYVSIFEFEDDLLLCKVSVTDKQRGRVWDTTRGVIGRVARTGRPALVLDVRTDLDYVMENADVVSEVCVPIIREGRVEGIVNVEESRMGALKEDDLALLMVLSEQLAIAATNASMYREALSRERFATRLGHLGMTVTSTLDLTQLVEILCREALALFNTDTAIIYLREFGREPVRHDSVSTLPAGELAVTPAALSERARLVCRASAGVGREALLGTVVPVDQLGNLVARAMRLARGFVVTDAHNSSQLSEDLREIVRPESCLAVPIMKEREVIGVLVLCDRQDPRRFAEPELARAAIVASQAGLAISNARLFQEAQRRAKEQSSLHEIGLSVSSTLNPDEQLRIIYDQITKHFQLRGFYVALRDENDDLNFALYVEQGKVLAAFVKPIAQAGFAGWVVTSRRALAIDDIEQQWDTLPVKPDELGAQAEDASYIGIPLVIKSEAMGVMALQRSPVEPFRADEQRFLFSLSQQIAFALENARLHQQSQRRAAQQSLLYQASRRIAGALTLNSLLKGIVDALTEDFGFRAVMVMLLDTDLNELRPAIWSSDIAHYISPAYRQTAGNGLLGVAAQTGQTQLFVSAGESTAEQDDAQRVLEEWHLNSQVAVPIKLGNRTIGALNVESAARNAFAADDVRMFEAIADQLAVAMENAKLFTAAQDRLERINALQTIEVSILSTMNLVDRLDLILKHTLTQMRADLCVIFLRDPHTRELFGLRQRGSLDILGFRQVRFKEGEGAAGWIMEHGEPLYIREVELDSRWVGGQRSDRERIVSYLGVPLQVEGHTIGVIDVATRLERLFTDEEISFFITLASHAAVAIENARLYERARAQLEQLRDTQDRLVETERRAAIGELVAGLAHEINNPLTAIVGHSQLLMETIPGGSAGEGWRGELDTISVAAQRIARIVQEFIKLSHVEGGLYETVDLGDVVRNAVEKFAARDDAQDIAILDTVPPEALLVKANGQLIDQVIQNILLNSLEAMPHGGRIDVQAGFSEGHTVYCSVRDSGYGIPASDLKRVFEPGYTTKVEAGVVRGIGLGLYTAERIIKSHGGSIRLESQAGKFTLATFILPRVPTEIEPLADKDAYAAAVLRPLEAERDAEVESNDSTALAPVDAAALNQTTRRDVAPTEDSANGK